MERLKWLWARFSQHNLTHLTYFLQPKVQNFETEILWLIQRYVTILPKKKPKHILTNNQHHTIPPEITELLINSFQITHSYYSSPLTCPIQITQYNSPHTRDIIFGSLGHAHSSRWKGHGLAFPPDYNTTLQAIHWARMAAKENTHTSTILIINHQDWTPQKLNLTNVADIHVIATIPPHTMQYKPTPEWPQYYQYTETSLTSIIYIHNQLTPATRQQFPNNLRDILKRITNTYIDIHPIQPTPNNYHIKFSKAWKIAPKENTPPNTPHILPHTPPQIPPATLYIHGRILHPTFQKLRRTNNRQYRRLRGI